MEPTDDFIPAPATRPRVSDRGLQTSGLESPTSDLRPLTLGSGLFLHASAVVMGDGAALFLGHSTAGKSTIARKLAAAWKVLADDSVFAAQDADGIWRVVDGGFRFGQGWGVAEWQEEVRRLFRAGQGIPLRTCFRIHQAAAVRIEPLLPVELGKHLMDAAMEIDVQRKFGLKSSGSKTQQIDWQHVTEQRRQWFHLAAAMARTSPGWHLWFAKDTPTDELCACIARAQS